MNALGRAAKYLRKARGLSQREMAGVLGITAVHLCNIEGEKKNPSRDICDRYLELWGIDLYIFAWCKYGDWRKLPKAIQGPMRRLAAAWEKELEANVVEPSNDAKPRTTQPQRFGSRPW